MTVLDVGSGTGFYVRLWRELGVRKLVASDFSGVATRKLKGDFADIGVLQLDIGSREIPLEFGSFSVVSAFDVLFHLTDDEQYRVAIENVSRLLKPGGWFCFSENFLHTDEIRQRHHVSRSREDIEALLRECDFVRVVRRPMLYLMNTPIDSESRIPRMVWRVVEGLVPGREKMGWLIGAMLFPIDVLITRVTRESPTTELCLCQKRLST